MISNPYELECESLNDKATAGSSGKPYSGSDEDRNGLMGDLDRRSLNAVATNEGGKFTAQEQSSAQALMRQRGRLATGYYSGPADQEKNWNDPFINDPFGRANAPLDFMDNMSPEEKHTRVAVTAPFLAGGTES